MKILGINGLNHDAALTLLQDGEVLFDGHSERYSGIKNDDEINDESKLEDGFDQCSKFIV